MMNFPPTTRVAMDYEVPQHQPIHVEGLRDFSGMAGTATGNLERSQETYSEQARQRQTDSEQDKESFRRRLRDMEEDARSRYAAFLQFLDSKQSEHGYH